MAPARGSAELPNATLNMLFEKMGEVQAGVREAKHAANGASQKIDSVAGKVDALALVVATQGEIRNHVERLEITVKEQGDEIETLSADKHRREGAIGLVEWISKHWPFIGLAAIIIAWIGIANGIFHP
jgi:hypothetical protein